MFSYFDMHCDTAVWTYNRGGGMRESGGHYDFSRARGRHIQVLALCGEDDVKTPGLFARYIVYTKRQIYENRDLVTLCLGGEDMDRALAQGKTGALLSVEGAELIGCGLSGLEAAWREGVRIVNLTWNHNNALAGCAVLGGGGLTEEGKLFVQRMRELRMTVDVSHLSDEAFDDLAALDPAAFIASHSNARSVCPHPRNLTDAQFCEIVRRGGLCGVNLYHPFLTAQDVCKLSHAVSHIEHFCALGGENALALGADFDGCDRLPDGIAGVQDIARLYEELLRLGYPQRTVDGIFYDNAYKYFRYRI